MNYSYARQEIHTLLKVIRDMRWIGIATVLVAYPLGGINTGWVLGLLSLAIFYNTLLLTPWAIRMIGRFSLPVMLAIDCLLLFILILLSGGLVSPYFFYICMPLIITAYWYGVRAFLWMLLLVSVVTTSLIVLALLSPPPFIPFWLRGIGYVAAIVMAGVLVHRLTVSERDARTIAASASARAEAERARLLSLINSMADAVIATNKRGIISDYNSAALDLLNTNESLKGHTLQKHIAFQLAENDEPINIVKLAARQKSTLKRSDLQFINNSGEKVKLSVSISKISGDVMQGGFIVILRDITKEKTLEEQRDEFISVASHELRTPLAIAEANIGTALLPEVGTLSPKARELIEHAHENVIFLGKLVRDLTTLVEAEKDILEVQVAVVDPAKILDNLANDYREQIEQKGLKLQVQINDNLPPVVTSEQHIREVLQNFLTNAIKYTQKGTITLKVSRAEDAPDNLVFSVSDTGIGISGSDQKKLFTKFYRSEDFRTRETGGTGVGLYITEKLAQRLNAHIWFDSKLNEGSTFYLRVPPFSRLRRDQGQVINAQVENIISNI